MTEKYFNSTYNSFEIAIEYYAIMLKEAERQFLSTYSKVFLIMQFLKYRK